MSIIISPELMTRDMFAAANIPCYTFVLVGDDVGLCRTFSSATVKRIGLMPVF